MKRDMNAKCLLLPPPWLLPSPLSTEQDFRRDVLSVLRRALGRLTIQRSHRLVSLAVRSVTLAGAMSGGACRVWIFLEGWLGGLVPTMLTWRMRKLGVGKSMSETVRGCAPPLSLSGIAHPEPVWLPVIGEGVQVGHLHGTGIRLVGELVDQEPLLSLPDHTHLGKGGTLGLKPFHDSRKAPQGATIHPGP